MNYKNAEMKIEELVGSFRDGKINLVPSFQRGRVWKPRLRQKLLENMVQGKPIPAIFLYKEPSGSKYSYNILDGKQRLESILLFIGGNRPDLAIPQWKDYFFKSDLKANFKINIALPGERAKKKTFAELDEDLVREFREYRIPTIEIDFDKDYVSLEEVINLFIDINQLGVRVNRFDIVRTMYEDNKLLANVFKLVAIKQKRKKDYFYKMIDGDFTAVLKRLQVVQTLTQPQERVDRIWERLLEIVLFVRTGQHRTLAQILKSFIGVKVDSSKITSQEMSQLRHLFTFLRGVYAQAGVKTSKMATDQTHFYTMITSIHTLHLVNHYGIATLKKKLVKLSRIIDGKAQPPQGKVNAFREYMELSSKQTTHPGRRATRQERFAELVEVL
jgi:hypothetical protein